MFSTDLENNWPSHLQVQFWCRSSTLAARNCFMSFQSHSSLLLLMLLSSVSWVICFCDCFQVPWSSCQLCSALPWRSLRVSFLLEIISVSKYPFNSSYSSRFSEISTCSLIKAVISHEFLSIVIAIFRSSSFNSNIWIIWRWISLEACFFFLLGVFHILLLTDVSLYDRGYEWCIVDILSHLVFLQKNIISVFDVRDMQSPDVFFTSGTKSLGKEP